MTEAEKLLEGYEGKLKPRALKIAENIIKLERLIKTASQGIEKEPIYIVELVGDRCPHEVKRENPAIKEYKSLIQNHADLVKKLKDILEIHEEPKPEEQDEWDLAFEGFKKK